MIMIVVAGFSTSSLPRCHLLATCSWHCPSLFVRLCLRGWTQSTCRAAAWRSYPLSSFTATTSHISISKTTLYHCTKVFQHSPGEFLSLRQSLLSVKQQEERTDEKRIFLFLILSFGCGTSLCGFYHLGDLPYGLKRKQLRSNYRWRVCGRLCGVDD